MDEHFISVILNTGDFGRPPNIEMMSNDVNAQKLHEILGTPALFNLLKGMLAQ